MFISENEPLNRRAYREADVAISARFSFVVEGQRDDWGPRVPQQDEIFEDWELEDVEGVIERLFDDATSAALHGEDVELDDGEYGCICLVNEARHTLLPCRHSLLCFQCAVSFLIRCRKNLKSGDGPSTPTCPICRTEIVDLAPYVPQ